MRDAPYRRFWAHASLPPASSPNRPLPAICGGSTARLLTGVSLFVRGTNLGSESTFRRDVETRCQRPGPDVGDGWLP